MRLCLTILACGALIGCSAGCQKNPHRVAPVHGRVTLDGRPLAVGRVMLAPIADGNALDAGKPAYGWIQPDGSYQLSTYSPSDGAIVGKHWVTIYASGPPEPEGNTLNAAVVNQSDRTNTPKFDYIKFPREPVSIVADQDNSLDVALTSKAIRQFGVRDD